MNDSLAVLDQNEVAPEARSRSTSPEALSNSNTFAAYQNLRAHIARCAQKTFGLETEEIPEFHSLTKPCPTAGGAFEKSDSSVAPTTPLMMAAGYGDRRRVRQLLLTGADLHASDEHGHNALFWALRWDKADSASELLAWGAKLTEDALCGPVRNGNAALVKLLIEHGANPNIRFRRFDDDALWPDGETLLGYAVTVAGIFGYPMEIIRLLINAGANVNAPTTWLSPARRCSSGHDDCTLIPPLRIAAQRGMEDVMKLLWDAGAKGTLQEALSDCSFECAIQSNCVVAAHC